MAWNDFQHVGLPKSTTDLGSSWYMKNGFLFWSTVFFTVDRMIFSLNPYHLALGGCSMALKRTFAPTRSRVNREQWEIASERHPTTSTPWRGVELGFAKMTLGESPTRGKVQTLHKRNISNLKVKGSGIWRYHTVLPSNMSPPVESKWTCVQPGNQGIDSWLRVVYGVCNTESTCCSLPCLQIIYIYIYLFLLHCTYYYILLLTYKLTIYCIDLLKILWTPMTHANDVVTHKYLIIACV